MSNRLTDGAEVAEASPITKSAWTEMESTRQSLRGAQSCLEISTAPTLRLQSIFLKKSQGIGSAEAAEVARRDQGLFRTSADP
jgi:hypothetical protein